jgi:hypothetical protein
MSQEPKLEEQALSKAVEIGLSTQLDDAEKINVDVQTDLFKIVQGQADGVSVVGEGLVIQKDIRIQELQLQTTVVDVNPLSVLFGQIELNKPLSAKARIVLNETDINKALASDYIRSKMQNFQLNVNGDIVTLEPRQIQLFLPGEGKIKVNGTIILHENESRVVSFTALIRPRTQQQPIMLESFSCTEGEGFSLELVVAFMQKIKELVNSPYLELEDMAFNIKKMEVGYGVMTLIADAHIKKLPTS